MYYFDQRRVISIKKRMKAVKKELYLLSSTTASIKYQSVLENKEFNELFQKNIDE